MRTRRLLIGLLLVWVLILGFVATRLQVPAEVEAELEQPIEQPATAATTKTPVALIDPPSPPPVDDATATGSSTDAVDSSATATSANASIVAAARSRVAAEAAQRPVDEEADVEHTALQGAAVELLTAQSECMIQTFTNRLTARASSVYMGDGAERAVARSRHGAALAFDADVATSYHSACGLPNTPWWVSYNFGSPTTVSTIKLTSDAPADFPRSWELQGRADARGSFVTLLQVGKDAGITCSMRLRQFRCDQARTRSYEVRSPGDYVEYRLLVHSVTNTRRNDRNCLQLAEITFVGPCAASNLVLHLDASAVSSPIGSLVAEWRDQSGHGHHARRRGAPETRHGVAGAAPLVLPGSADFDVAEASEAPAVVDDGGSPRLVTDPLSGRPALSWEYSSGGGFLEAAGLTVGASDSMSVFVVTSTRAAGWPSRGSKVKPIYCLGDPAFWAGTLCVSGIVGNSSYAAYGGRGQPGEGEYLTGLTADVMEDGALHILAVTLDGPAGLFRAYVDGVPALVPSFISATTPTVGTAQIGGSSTSRSRRFHGLISEIVCIPTPHFPWCHAACPPHPTALGATSHALLTPPPLVPRGRYTMTRCSPRARCMQSATTCSTSTLSPAHTPTSTLRSRRRTQLVGASLVVCSPPMVLATRGRLSRRSC